MTDFTPSPLPWFQLGWRLVGWDWKAEMTGGAASRIAFAKWFIDVETEMSRNLCPPPSSGGQKKLIESSAKEAAQP